MNLVKWRPLKELSPFEDRFDRLFDASFLPTVGMEDTPGSTQWRPVVDVYDREDKIVIKAELPGLEKKDIKVDVKDRVLTLKGERSYENEVKEGKYYRKERAFGKFERAFTLHSDIDSGKIEAEYKDGVLRVEIPKPEEEKPKKIMVH